MHQCALHNLEKLSILSPYRRYGILLGWVSVGFWKITFFWKARRLTQHLTGLVLRITLCGIKLLILVIARLQHENINRKKTHLENLCNNHKDILKIKSFCIQEGQSEIRIKHKFSTLVCYDIWYGTKAVTRYENETKSRSKT